MKITRRQIETIAAASLAAVTAILGIAFRDSDRTGPKFLALEKVGAFREPVHLTQAPGTEQLFITEKPGRIRVVDHGRVVRRPFLDIRGKVKDNGKGDEQGLLSAAFPEDYSDSGRFYIAYTDDRNDLEVVEYQRSEESDLRADRGSARPLLRIGEPTTKHHGGLLLFGPDGHLYVGSGDGGPSGDPNDSSQNKRLLLGKILRIDPLPPDDGEGRPGRKGGSKPYTIPSDNPLVGRPGRDEIYAYGLRNPWRFSFDRATRALSIGDVGDVSFEEIDYVAAGRGKGANFGWSFYEGLQRRRPGLPKSKTVRPIHIYRHGPGCSVIGGFVVRDPRLSGISGRELVGRYLFGDYCAGKLYAFRPQPQKAGKNRKLRFNIPELSSFGEDEDGRIYIVSKRGGVWRLVARRKRE